MAHTYNFRTRKSPVQPSPPTTQTATTRRSKATQREPASSKTQKKAVAQVKITSASTRRSKRGRAAETSDERPRKRRRSNDEPPHSDVRPQPLPTRRPKRGRPFEPTEERVRKRRRANDEPPRSDSRSRTRRQEKRRNGRLLEMRKMRGDADRVRRLVAETEDSLARMILLVRHVPVDIERWDARHGDPPGVPLGHKDAAVQIDPSTEKEDSIPLEDDQGLDDTREVTTEELKAFVQSFRRIRSRVNEEAATAFSREDVRAVTTLSEDWSEEHPALHDCRRSADQQARFDTHKILQPRPRIGVDEQGHPYNDWSACQPEPRPRKRLQRERVVMSQLWMRFDHLVPETDVRLHPAPICPRQPRIFADQHQVRFSDVPQTVHYVLERWHRTYGRCCDCIVRAMRTFPPWIMKTHEADESMDGNPVFTNNLDDELVEWDETRRRWRHLVLDHYRWIPVHDLEERTNDSTADPEILNGTTDVPVPEDDWAWTRVDLSTLRGVY